VAVTVRALSAAQDRLQQVAHPDRAPTKRSSASKIATGAASRCMASITGRERVVRRAQKVTASASATWCSAAAQASHSRGRAVALAGGHAALGVEAKPCRLASVDPALSRSLQVAGVAHDVEGGEHIQRVHMGHDSRT
jgi:hypothetical protein